MRTPNCILSIALILLTAILPGQSQSRDPVAGSSNKRDAKQMLVSAKTVSIVSQVGEMAQTGRWIWDPNPERARNALQKELQKWGRLTMVEDASQADLVLVIIEGNRSSFLKKGELFEKLLVFPGGTAAPEGSPLWQEEAKEGVVAGRPVGKLIEHLRKQIEEYEKSGSPAMSAAASRASEPKAMPVVQQGAPSPADVDPAGQASEPTEETPSKPLAAGDTRSLDPPVLGGHLENRMLQPIPDKFAPSAQLLTARTAAVVSYGPQPEGGTKGFVGGMLTGTPAHKQANAKRAKKDMENEIRKWNRYTLVDDPTQADIVIAVREWNHIRMLGREYLASRVAVFKGGADFEPKLEMLWGEEYETDFGSTTKIVAKDFRHVLEKLGKQTKKE